MQNSITRNFAVLRPRFGGNLGLLVVMFLSFTACSSQIVQDVELAVQEADRIATQQDLARAALEKERQRALEQEAREIEVAAERARQAERADIVPRPVHSDVRTPPQAADAVQQG